MDLNEQETGRALRMSTYDGALAAMMASLAGGIFLVGFALNVLGATTVQVGILAALPISANLAQLLGSIWIEKFGHRRKFCIVAVTAGRLMWIPVVLLPLAMFDAAADARVWLLVGFVAIASVLGALSGVAWLEWMGDLIPANIRGGYLGRRNMVSAASGMVAILAGGAFLSYWDETHGTSSPYGYMAIFGTGLLLGLIASCVLTRVPDPQERVKPAKPAFCLSVMMAPFRERNFLALVIYVSAFMFSTQIAGPFYSVYMIENLQIDFASITWFITFATLASLFMLRIWGPISDQLGNRPVLIVAGAAHALIPLMWLVTRPDNYYWALVLAHVLSGIFFSAITLAQINILLKLAPSTGRSVYIAVFNASIGLSVIIAPVIGGWLLDLSGNWELQTGDWNLNNLHFLFLLSGGLQLCGLIAILRVKEEGAAGPVAVILQLQNDLNPQTGIANATDFVAVRVSRSTGVLRGLDERSDAWAEACERRVARLLDRLVKPRGSRLLQSIGNFIKND
jgi:MFS family permease